MKVEARFVKRERTTLGLTVAKLATRARVSADLIESVEAGETEDIPRLTVRRIARALGIKTHDLAKGV